MPSSATGPLHAILPAFSKFIAAANRETDILSIHPLIFFFPVSASLWWNFQQWNASSESPCGISSSLLCCIALDITLVPVGLTDGAQWEKPWWGPARLLIESCCSFWFPLSAHLSCCVFWVNSKSENSPFFNTGLGECLRSLSFGNDGSKYFPFNIKESDFYELIEGCCTHFIWDETALCQCPVSSSEAPVRAWPAFSGLVGSSYKSYMFYWIGPRTHPDWVFGPQVSGKV